MVMVQLVHSKQKIAVAPVPFLSLSSLSKTLLENSIFDRTRVDYPTFFFFFKWMFVVASMTWSSKFCVMNKTESNLSDRYYFFCFFLFPEQEELPFVEEKLQTLKGTEELGFQAVVIVL